MKNKLIFLISIFVFLFVPMTVSAYWNASGTSSKNGTATISWGQSLVSNYSVTLNYNASADINSGDSIAPGQVITFTFAPPTGTLMQTGGTNDTPFVAFGTGAPTTSSTIKTWALDYRNIVDIEFCSAASNVRLSNGQLVSVSGDNQSYQQEDYGGLPLSSATFTMSKSCRSGVQSLGAFVNPAPTYTLTSSNPDLLTCSGNTCTANAISTSSGSATVTASVPANNISILFARVCQPDSSDSLSSCATRSVTQNIPTSALTLGGSMNVNVVPVPTIAPTYTITGNVFSETTVDGIKDASEGNYAVTPNISISPNAGTITTNADGSYTITNLPAGTYVVSYNSLPTGYHMTSPLNGPPSSYQVTVGPGCNVSSAKGASCQ